jgi:hypothetical protein
VNQALAAYFGYRKFNFQPLGGGPGGLQFDGDGRAISRLLPNGWQNLTFILGHYGTAVVAIALSN